MSEPENEEIIDTPELPGIADKTVVKLVEKHGLLWVSRVSLTDKMNKLAHGGDMMLKYTRPGNVPMVLRTDCLKLDVLRNALVQARAAALIHTAAVAFKMPYGEIIPIEATPSN